MPNDADAAIAFRMRGADRRIDRRSHGMKLVVAGDLLDHRITVGFKHHEVPQKFE